MQTNTAYIKMWRITLVWHSLCNHCWNNGTAAFGLVFTFAEVFYKEAISSRCDVTNLMPA